MPLKWIDLVGGGRARIEDIDIIPEERLGMPLPLARACLKLASREKYCDYSVTELASPVQQRVLMQRHDWSVYLPDSLWAADGAALHHLLALGGEADALTEEKIVLDFNGVSVGGTLDHFSLSNGGTLTDYKKTSVWSGILIREKDLETEHPEWVAQVNAYACLLENRGITALNLRLCLVYRDWSERDRTRSKRSYPRERTDIFPVPSWGVSLTGTWIQQRIMAFHIAEGLEDPDLPRCTEQETWGGKRCERYCPAQPFCHQYEKEGAR